MISADLLRSIPVGNYIGSLRYCGVPLPVILSEAKNLGLWEQIQSRACAERSDSECQAVDVTCYPTIPQRANIGQN